MMRSGDELPVSTAMHNWAGGKEAHCKEMYIKFKKAKGLTQENAVKVRKFR
jgi:hypothetical protein